MRRLFLLLTIIAMLLAGCGQKGPLYRPEADSGAQESDRVSGGNSGAQEAD